MPLSIQYTDFRAAREQGNIREMVRLYREKVINYKPNDTKKYKPGQQAFFREIGGLTGVLMHPHSYFKKQSSPAELLRLAIPGLIDLTNPDALDPLEVEHFYWADSENAKSHTIQTLYTIPGFRDAHEKGDIKTMADLYRKFVIPYQPKDRNKYTQGGQRTFFYEVGGLASIIKQYPYLKKKGSPAELVRLAIPGLINSTNPDALQLYEVERKGYNIKTERSFSDTLGPAIAQTEILPITTQERMGLSGYLGLRDPALPGRNGKSPLNLRFTDGASPVGESGVPQSDAFPKKIWPSDQIMIPAAGLTDLKAQYVKDYGLLLSPLVAIQAIDTDNAGIYYKIPKKDRVAPELWVKWILHTAKNEMLPLGIFINLLGENPEETVKMSGYIHMLLAKIENFVRMLELMAKARPKEEIDGLTKAGTALDPVEYQALGAYFMKRFFVDSKNADQILGNFQERSTKSALGF